MLYQLFLVLSLAASSVGFSTVKTSAFLPSTKIGHDLKESTSLYVSFSPFTEDEAHFALTEARECAFSDSAYSYGETERLLNQVLQIQSGCASGTLHGEDLCQDQQSAAEIVAHLRAKLEKEQSQLSSREAKNESMMSAIGVVVLMVCFWRINFSTPDVIPFTTDEWVWAAQGGYLNDMLAHYFRNGGL